MHKEPSDFSIKLLRKIKIPFIRKWLLKRRFRKSGVPLQDFFSYNNDRFFIYKVDDIFLPDESLYWPVSFASKMQKCKNESLFAYQPDAGDIILDIGAGLGEETILYAKLVGDKGRVISIEANPEVYEILQTTIALNKLANVDAINLAIYRNDGMVSLSGSKNVSYEAAFLKQESQNTDMHVRAVRLDHFLEEQQIKRIDLLKVNIEGSERFVMETLSPAQLSNIRHIAIACHDFRYHKEGNEFFRTKEYVREQLLKNGFEIITRNTGTDYLDDWIYATNKRIQY